MSNLIYLLELISKKIKKCIDIDLLEKLEKKDIKQIVKEKDWSKLGKSTYFNELPKDIIFELTNACKNQIPNMYLISLFIGGDTNMRDVINKTIIAENEKEAMKNFLLNDKEGHLVRLFDVFEHNYGDNKSTKFPQGETKFYCDQLKKINVLPYSSTWEYYEDYYDENKEFIKVMDKFYKDNIDTLVPYFLDWTNDNREITLRKIEINEYY